MNELIDLNSLRAKEARLAKTIGRSGYLMLVTSGTIALLGAGAIGYFSSWPHSLFLIALALIFYLPAIWWKQHLSKLPPDSDTITGHLSVDVLKNLRPGTILQPRTVWDGVKDHWQAIFFTNHLLLHQDVVYNSLSDRETDLALALQTAAQIAAKNNSPIIEPGFVVAGLMLSSPAIKQLLVKNKALPTDIESMADWLGRNIEPSGHQKRNYGGIGRDWAFGFTPLLDRLGQNLSQAIMRHGSHFGALTNSAGVLALESAFRNHNSTVALIGPDGIGKTTSVYAFAQRLIEGETDTALAYHQVIDINATDILSRAHSSGDLERIMIGLANEAAHASNIIIFLDNAQLFFANSPGSFDGSQILMSIAQAGSVPMILALTPNDYQRLKSYNQSLASLLTPIMLQEMSQADIMRVLEDEALRLEYRHNVMVAYEALKEAYQLSGRYEQDEAYPGKAIKLLTQAVANATHSIIDASSVQKVIEQSRGVKVSAAQPAEADSLLHLEDNIHQRMINQTHAVSVVANALRRARAGVSNPNRPIGSFLFLGPTGVGKTELAKSVAATYFGNEGSMIRLDMSEYQQPDDVQRLLSTGQNDNTSLVMSVRQQPFAVVLLDEIEKAHPNILNLLIQLLDEGRLTDSTGRAASFKDCVIIATSNAGAETIRERIASGQSLESFRDEFNDQLIKSGQFKPELINRFDEIVLFRPLTEEELGQIVQIMLREVNQTLAAQNISVELTEAMVKNIVSRGYDPRLGARPMRRALQSVVEDTVAQKILSGEAQPGDHIKIDVPTS